MKLDLSYAEMALLRKLVEDEKQRRWLALVEKAGKAFEDKPVEEMNELREKYFREPTKWQVTISDEQRIGRLLRKFRELEETCQQAMKEL